MALNYTCKTTANLYNRTGPSISYSAITIIPYGTQVTAIDEKGNWYKIKEYGGWSSKTYLTVISKNDTTTTAQSVSKEEMEKRQKEAEAKKKAQLEAQQMELYSKYVANDYSYDSDIAKTLLISNLNGVYGMPYQFSPEVDRLLEGTDFGTVYADKIVAKMPLLLMMPGKASYMSSFKKSDKMNALKKTIGIAMDSDDSTTLSNIIKGSGRYYTFEFDYNAYYEYFNSLNRVTAKFLGIDGVEVNIGGSKAKLSRFNWKNATNSAFKQYVSQAESIAYYVDSASTVDESITNTTTESQLASKINSFSDLGRELSFLLGAGVGIETDFLSQNEDQFKSALSEMESMVDKYVKGEGANQFLKDLGSNFKTVATGGKLIFPEIWADSEYSKSYDINIKLRTPDCDKLSWYMNIAVPLNSLITFALPRQLSANGYMSPFLIRAFHKGLFNCDCGIITSMNISKGKEGSWTIDGLPTEIDVNFQLKDLYQMLTLTKGDDVGWFMNNTALMDYLACNCGININKPEIERTLDIYFMLKTNKITDLPNKMWSGAQQKISNLMMNAYKGINSILR